MLEIKYLPETTSSIGLLTTSTVVFLSFLLSTAIAFVYVWTLKNESYSRNYLQSIVLISIIGAVIILSVGDNLARGIGIIAAVGIIRFRTNFKNPRDTVFLFAALSAGIACGSNAFIVAIEGTFCFSIAAIYLRYAPFSPIKFYDGVIHFKCDPANMPILREIIESSCKKFALISMKESANHTSAEYAYNIKLNKGITSDDFVSSISFSKLASDVSFSLE